MRSHPSSMGLRTRLTPSNTSSDTRAGSWDDCPHGPPEDLAPIFPLRPNHISEWLGWVIRNLGDCQTDREGHCQQHFLDSPCPVAEMKEYLDAEVPCQGP
jgi:hypothetical protein